MFHVYASAVSEISGGKSSSSPDLIVDHRITCLLNFESTVVKLYQVSCFQMIRHTFEVIQFQQKRNPENSNGDIFNPEKLQQQQQQRY